MQSDSEDETGCEIKQEKSRSCQNSNEESQNKNKMAEIAKVFETFLNKKEEVTKKLPSAHNILGVKLKYEHSRGIDSFLSLIDTVVRTNKGH